MISPFLKWVLNLNGRNPQRNKSKLAELQLADSSNRCTRCAGLPFICVHLKRNPDGRWARAGFKSERFNLFNGGYEKKQTNQELNLEALAKAVTSMCNLK